MSLVFEDAIFIREGETGYDNEVHREFWFNPPKEGWKQEPKTLEILKPMTETEIGQAWPQYVIQSIHRVSIYIASASEKD